MMSAGQQVAKKHLAAHIFLVTLHHKAHGKQRQASLAAPLPLSFIALYTAKITKCIH